MCQPECRIDGVMISCGQRCSVGRTWPPCVACRSCGTCCRCRHSHQHQAPAAPQEEERIGHLSQVQASYIREASDMV
jgi:hypothetical protein